MINLQFHRIEEKRIKIPGCPGAPGPPGDPVAPGGPRNPGPPLGPGEPVAPGRPTNNQHIIKMKCHLKTKTWHIIDIYISFPMLADSSYEHRVV